MRAIITILDLGYDYGREIAELNKLGLDAEFMPLEGTDDIKKISAALKKCEFVLAGPELWSDETFREVGKQLKLIVRLGVGIDRIDLAAATRRGVAVCNAPGGNACSVAQHALALMMDLSLGITRYDRVARSGIPCKRTMSSDVIGKTVGLLGFGNISAQLAKLLAGFSCTLLAYDVCKDERLAAALGVHFIDLDGLLASSDYVSVHLPLTESTRGMVDIDFLKQMKNTAYFINTARGQIVNEADLVFALQTGMIAGAGLDVFEKTLAESELLQLDNVVVTPYVAFSSALGNQRTLDMAIGSIRDYLVGREPKNLLNPEYIRNIVRQEKAPARQR